MLTTVAVSSDMHDSIFVSFVTPASLAVAASERVKMRRSVLILGPTYHLRLGLGVGFGLGLGSGFGVRVRVGSHLHTNITCHQSRYSI